MSRIGKLPVEIPEGVTVTLEGLVVKVKGPKGELEVNISEDIEVAVESNQVIVKPKKNRALWGLTRTLILNAVTGVSTGFTKRLEISGVGYNSSVAGKILKLKLGYSHEIFFAIPDGIDIKCEKPTLLAINGIDKQQVGEVAAIIRRQRPPEPYKGKGVRYEGEYIRRKEGKKK